MGHYLTLACSTWLKGSAIMYKLIFFFFQNLFWLRAIFASISKAILYWTESDQWAMLLHVIYSLFDILSS